MRFTRTLALSALALALAMAGCSNTTPEPTPDDQGDTATESPTPTETESTPESTPPASSPTGTPAPSPAEVSSNIKTDAHPFCEVLAEMQKMDTGDPDYIPTAADLPKIQQIAEQAKDAAPAEIKDEADLYFTTMVELAEEMVETGKPITEDVLELNEDLQEAFGAVLTFAFESCLDLDISFD